MIKVGGGKKGKGSKKNKQKDVVVEEAFNIDFAIINKFGFLKVSPPMGPSDLDSKIDELRKKKEDFEKEGEDILKKETEEFDNIDEDAIEKEVEEEQEFKNEDRRGGRGFRGKYRGSGRGGRGGRGDYKPREGRTYKTYDDDYD